MQPFIGGIIIFAGPYAPIGWAYCNGQIINVNENEPLFSLLGSIYGGNGRTTFGLPDLRGRIPLHKGSGVGLNPITLGQKSGSETITLAANNWPSHSHTVNAHGGGKGTATTDNPSGAIPGDANSNIYSTESADITMNASMISGAGSASPSAISIIQSFQVVNFIIALQGIMPTQT